MRGIRYISLHEPSGYGEAARRYLAGLRRTGIPLTWTPMVPGTAWGLGYQPYAGDAIGDACTAPLCNAPVDYDTVIVHTVPEYYPLWRRMEPGRRLVGYTVWETDRPPRHWAPLLDSVDQLVVPCRWNRQVFVESGVRTPIAVVPHLLCEAASSSSRPAASPFVFYTISTWTARKALWHTVGCYLDSFTADDDVRLVIKTSPEDFTRRPRLGRFFRRSAATLRQLERRHRHPARITLRTERLSRAELRALHQQGDCYLSLARAEGWGLGLYDAARLGKPVIATGFGGQLDYLPAELAYLVDYDLVPVDDAQGRPSYTPDQRWAEPRPAHASRLMRQVFGQRDEARARGAALRDHLERNFGDEVIIDRLVSAASGGDR